MAYIPKGNSAWLLRKAINRSDSAIADLETNLTTLARTASNTGTSTTTQVLFNDAGIVNGDAGLVYNKTTDALSVGGTLGVTGAATLSSTLAVTGATTLTGAATVQGLTLGKGASAIATNTAFGNNVLAVNTTGLGQTAIGSNAMAAMQSGYSNTAVGNSALEANVVGVAMTAVGNIALLQNVSGSFCTAVGSNAAYQSTGSNTTAVGYAALTSLVAGDNNTAVGFTAGSAQTSGANNGFFGAGSYGDSNTASNSYNYGDGSVATHKFRAGNVVVGTGNVVMSTSGKGIDFSATLGTGTSELLADYEEGTWSPTPSGEVNLTSVVSVSAQYTKVGRLVTVSGLVSANVTLASTLTYFRLPTLPFVNAATTVGTVFADGVLKAGGAQVFGNSLSGYFPAASAIGAGAATFYYNVTYSV